VYQQITLGICVSVETIYNNDMSNPSMNEYIYAYKISIDNYSDFPFQLKTRHWEITDAYGNLRVVDGEGVVGKQPIIDPGESFQYMSGVGVKTDMGLMEGFYTVENLNTKEEISIGIPEFKLIAPFKDN